VTTATQRPWIQDGGDVGGAAALVSAHSPAPPPPPVLNAPAASVGVKATRWRGGPRTPQATADPGTQAIHDQAWSPRPTPARLISTVACDSRTSVLARTLATDQSAKRSRSQLSRTHDAGPINNAHFVFEDQQQQLLTDKQRLDAHQ